MNHEDPESHTRVRVFMGGMAALMLVCLVGALAQPAVWLPRWLGWLVPVLFVVGLPWLVGVANRDRIRHAVGRRNGRVVSIRRLFWWRDVGWGDELGARYRVVYVDGSGERRLAVCRSDLLVGVQWLEDRPAAGSE